MATSDSRNVDWPASDLETRGAIDAVPISGQTAVPAKHLSKLAIDLAAAIRSTSESARDAQLAHVADEAKGVSARIAAQLLEGSAALRQQSDDDIAEVREWAKAEAARIKAESDAKIAARKLLLEGQIADHEAANRDREERLQAAVTGYQRTMDEFFTRFLAEEDPARLATIAETMPEPPSLEPFTEPVPARADIADQPALDAATAQADSGNQAAPEAEAEAAAAAVSVEAEPVWSADEAEAEAALIASGLEDEPMAPAPDAQPEPESELVAGAEAAKASKAQTTRATARDEPAPSVPASAAPRAASGDAGDLHSTQVIVSGLVSVASVASFRRALSRMTGVASVTVTSSPDGAFLFHVSHRLEVDFGVAIPSLPGFVAEITGMADGVVSVVTLDPETDR